MAVGTVSRVTATACHNHDGPWDLGLNISGAEQSASTHASAHTRVLSSSTHALARMRRYTPIELDARVFLAVRPFIHALEELVL